MKSRVRGIAALVVAGALVAVVPRLLAQQPYEWPLYGRDSAGTKYSPLRQINTSNVAKLQRAWTYTGAEKGIGSPEITPIVAGGMMYISTPKQRVVALEPETGKTIWEFDPKVDRPRHHRGVSYWPGVGRARILHATSDGRLIALDAETGKPATEFGTNGEVNLKAGATDKFPTAWYAITSPPAIYKNLAFVGPELQEGPSTGPAGSIRAFDLRNGKELWTFYLAPRPGEPGHNTWGSGGVQDRSGPSAWGPITVDAERGLVFAAAGNAADRFYGADRKGTNLYSASVVALDATTGKLKWHFQTTHHDIYDYDLAAGPSLIEVTQNGKKTAAVVQATKMGLLFILDRVTGKPLFGVEERPVPKSDVPGEEAWATQPFPLKPPPLARNSMKRDEVAHLSPESDRFCLEKWDQHPNRGPYTPPSMNGSSLFPGTAGGTGFGGVSFDPELGYIFVNTQSVGQLQKMAATPPGTAGRGAVSPMPYRATSTRFVDQNGYPCNAPPWGELSAVSASTGDVVWRVPLGNYPELEARGFKDFGAPNLGGSIATAGGLVFIAATNDHMFRAFDSKTGKLLWKAELEATGNATPSAYMGNNGKQYVVINGASPGNMQAFAGGDKVSDTIVAFSVP
jgi:glucose dehydrogenase